MPEINKHVDHIIVVTRLTNQKRISRACALLIPTPCIVNNCWDAQSARDRFIHTTSSRSHWCLWDEVASDWTKVFHPASHPHATHMHGPVVLWFQLFLQSRQQQREPRQVGFSPDITLDVAGYKLTPNSHRGDQEAHRWRGGITRTFTLNKDIRTIWRPYRTRHIDKERKWLLLGWRLWGSLCA